MIDAAAVTPDFQWGPVIAGLIVVVATAAVAWLSTTNKKIGSISEDVAVLKSQGTDRDEKIEQVRLDVKGVYDTVSRQRHKAPPPRQ